MVIMATVALDSQDPLMLQECVTKWNTDQLIKECHTRKAFVKMFDVNIQEATEDKPATKSEIVVETSEQKLEELRRQFTFKANSPKPFECDHCKKRFGTRVLVRQHLVQHSEVKPFKCQQCDKGFNYKQQFQLHMKSHTIRTVGDQCEVTSADPRSRTRSESRQKFRWTSGTRSDLLEKSVNQSNSREAPRLAISPQSDIWDNFFINKKHRSALCSSCNQQFKLGDEEESLTQGRFKSIFKTTSIMK